MNDLNDMDEVMLFMQDTTEQIYAMISTNWMLSFIFAIFIIGLVVKLIRRIMKLRG